MSVFDFDAELRTNPHLAELRPLPRVEKFRVRECFVCGTHIEKGEEVTPIHGEIRQPHHYFCWETASAALVRAVRR